MHEPTGVIDRALIVRLLGLSALVLLLVGCALTLWPFISAIVWGVILAVSMAPVHRWLARRVGAGAAAWIVSLLPLCAVLLPLFVFGDGLVSQFASLSGRIETWLASGPPHAPDWLRDLPLFGPDLHDWLETLLNDQAALVDALRKLIGPTRDFLLVALRKLGAGLLELSLSLVVMGVVLSDAASHSARLHRLLELIAGSRTRLLLAVATATVRSVVAGLIGTALAQALLAVLGFALAGTGSALFYGFLTFFLSFVPMGPALLWAPLAWQLYDGGHTGWAIFLVIWGAGVVGTIDNILKPVLIGRGVRLPMLLIFLGVLGGALSFGLIGVFIGPVLLAVMQNLLGQWLRGDVSAPPAPPAQS